MANLTATNFSVTINDRWISSKKKFAECTLSLASATGAYPSGGISLPTYPSWGFSKFVNTLEFYGDNGQGGYRWSVDVGNHKLKAFLAGATGAVLSQASAGTTIGTTARNFRVIAMGG